MSFQMLIALVNSLALGRTWGGKEAILTAIADVCVCAAKSEGFCAALAIPEDEKSLTPQKIAAALLKECKKEKKSYRVAALRAVGRTVKALKLAALRDIYDIVYPIVSSEEMSDEEHDREESAKDLVSELFLKTHFSANDDCSAAHVLASLGTLLFSLVCVLYCRNFARQCTSVWPTSGNAEMLRRGPLWPRSYWMMSCSLAQRLQRDQISWRSPSWCVRLSPRHPARPWCPPQRFCPSSCACPRMRS